MNNYAVLWSKIRALFSATRLDAEFADELESHLQLLTEAHLRRGLSPDEARRAARLDFGGSMQFIEDHREHRALPFVDTTMQDVRYAVRTLRKHRGYTAVVTLTLAIGVGAATSMFTVVHAVLLRPLPYPQPERLVEITETNPLKNWMHTVTAPANFSDWRKRNTVFTDIAGYIGVDDRGASQLQRFFDVNGEPQPVTGIAATGNLFDVLGAKPLLGRTFTWEETFDGNDRILVLSFGIWQSMFGGDPHVIGRTVSLSGRTKTVVGVMPRDFFFPNRTAQFWAPIGWKPGDVEKMRRPHYLNTIARLRPGVTLAQARDQMQRIAKDLEKQYPETNTQMSVRLEPLHDIMAADARPAILMLFGAVGVLFLIVCANIASLQLGRGSSRMREIAVRRALGAGRARLVRQLLTEALLLSVIGTSLGVALASMTPALLLRAAPSALPLFATPELDVRVLIFSAALAVIAPLVFALLPALSSSQTERLSDRSEGRSRQTTRSRDVLVTCEVALSVVLVIGAALLIRSLVELQRVDPGFRPDHVLSFKVNLPSVKYPKDDEMERAFTRIEEQLRQEPGIDVVGAAATVALRGYTYTSDATPEGHSGDDYQREARFNSVTPDYFKALGVRLLAGRWLTDHDTGDTAPILVNASLAKKYYGTIDVVGKKLKPGKPTDPDPWQPIAGVVADVKQDGLDKPTRPEIYMLYASSVQNPATFVVRSSLPPDSIAAAARAAVRATDREILLTEVTTLDDIVHNSTGDERFRTMLLAGFAGVALFLAAVGIYGVLAYVVTQRSRELGIRLALGARPSLLFRMVIAQGMRPVLIGAAAGIVVAVPMTKLIRSLLFGVTALDPVTYASAMSVLGVSAMIACALPAVRATRVDPLVALRDE